MKRNPIHKTIQALALLLFAFATVASAANVTLQTADDGTKYVYMPNGGTDYLNISAEEAENIAYGGKPFLVYADSKFNSGSRGLEINVPGYVMEIYGEISTDYCWVQTDRGGYDLHPEVDNISGSRHDPKRNLEKFKLSLLALDKNKKKAKVLKFEVKVKLIPVGAISLLPADVGGTATSFKILTSSPFNTHNLGPFNETTAYEGDNIVVTATPENGYFLKGLEIKEGDKVLSNIPITDMDWYSDATKHTVTFTMPHANITVKPVFTKKVTADDGFFIKMKFPFYTNALNVTIPNGVSSFKVYGYGKDDVDSHMTDYVKLVDPAGRRFEITGTVQTCETNGNNCYMYIGHDYDSERQKYKSFDYYHSNQAGTTTDIGTFVSSGNKVMIAFKVKNDKNTVSNDRLDLTVKLLSSSTSLDEDSQQDYKEVSRSEPLIIYSHMKNDRSFWYTLQSRHAVGSEWSDWAALEDKFDGHALDDHIESSYEIDHSFEIPWQNINSNYEYMEFRYSMNPFKENGNLSDERIYTSSVKVRLKNKVNVNVDANKTTSGDYILMTANGTKVDKDQFFDYGTPVKVQAIAPVGFRFKGWAGLETENNPVTLSSVVSDTTIRAMFESDVSKIQVVTYVSKNGDETWSSAENSPLDVDVTSAKGGNFKVTASISAKEELCGDGNGNKNCYAYIIMRKEGSGTWDTLANSSNVTYIKVSENTSYTANVERSVGYALLKGAQRFEIKTIVKETRTSEANIAESNSIYANLYHTLSVFHNCFDGGDNFGVGCGAIVEDEVGNMRRLAEDEKIVQQYGAKLKLHPLYPYDQSFWMWKVYSLKNSELDDPENYITKDSVCEFTLDSNMQFMVGVKYRNPDTVRVVPGNLKMPYAGMSEFSLLHSNEGSNGFKFASDTAFYIEKFIMNQGGWIKFAVNKLDSMFTPGTYRLYVKLVNESSYETERDSLWACKGYPVVYWMDEFLPNYEGASVECSENSPAVYHRRYQFTVNDTSFNVTFNTWDEENGKYVTVGETQKVAFGEVPATPDIDCPESNTDWKFSCNWATAFAPAVKDTAYTYQVVRSNSVLSIASVDGSKTATIAGSYNGNDAFKITEAVDVDNVELQRSFNQSKSGFSTIVLPFDFNASALTGVKSVIKFNRMTKNNGKLAVGMGYVWCDADVEASLKAEAAKTENPDDYDHCNSDWETFPGEMEAYTPYMVQMKDNQIGFNYVGGVMFEKTPDESEIQVSKEADDGVWEFRGTTQKKVWTAEETKDGYVWGFAAQIMGPANYIGKFVQLGEGASAEPLRAYMVFKPKDSNPPAQQVAPRNASFAAKPAKSLGTETASLPDEIDVVIESQGKDGEEHRTVIGTFTRSSGEFKMLRDYDLKGRKVNGVNKARGAYYGKKVLKK